MKSRCLRIVSWRHMQKFSFFLFFFPFFPFCRSFLNPDKYSILFQFCEIKFFIYFFHFFIFFFPKVEHSNCTGQSYCFELTFYSYGSSFQQAAGLQEALPQASCGPVIFLSLALVHILYISSIIYHKEGPSIIYYLHEDIHVHTCIHVILSYLNTLINV